MPVETLSQKDIEGRLRELPGWPLEGDRFAREYRLGTRFAATAMAVHIAQVKKMLWGPRSASGQHATGLCPVDADLGPQRPLGVDDSHGTPCPFAGRRPTADVRTA